MCVWLSVGCFLFSLLFAFSVSYPTCTRHLELVQQFPNFIHSVFVLQNCVLVWEDGKSPVIGRRRSGCFPWRCSHGRRSSGPHRANCSSNRFDNDESQKFYEQGNLELHEPGQITRTVQCNSCSKYQPDGLLFCQRGTCLKWDLDTLNRLCFKFKAMITIILSARAHVPEARSTATPKPKTLCQKRSNMVKLPFTIDGFETPIITITTRPSVDRIILSLSRRESKSITYHTWRSTRKRHRYENQLVLVSEKAPTAGLLRANQDFLSQTQALCAMKEGQQNEYIRSPGAPSYSSNWWATHQFLVQSHNWWRAYPVSTTSSSSSSTQQTAWQWQDSTWNDWEKRRETVGVMRDHWWYPQNQRCVVQCFKLHVQALANACTPRVGVNSTPSRTHIFLSLPQSCQFAHSSHFMWLKNQGLALSVVLVSLYLRPSSFRCLTFPCSVFLPAPALVRFRHLFRPLRPCWQEFTITPVPLRAKVHCLALRPDTNFLHQEMAEARWIAYGRRGQTFCRDRGLVGGKVFWGTVGVYSRIYNDEHLVVEFVCHPHWSDCKSRRGTWQGDQRVGDQKSPWRYESRARFTVQARQAAPRVNAKRGPRSVPFYSVAKNEIF